MAAVQWVFSAGGSLSVRATTRSATSAPNGGIREGRVLSRRSPSTPSSAKRSCQRQTQVFDLPVRRMISTVPTPSALSKTIRARQTCFWAALRSPTNVSRRRRSEGERSMDIPVRIPQTRIIDGFMDVQQRIRIGLIAFACGDAAGVPWEMKRPEEIVPEEIPNLPIRGDWPQGSVSDDTVFLLSTAQVVASGSASPHALLERLAADLPRARGAGRTSRTSIERFVTTGETRAKSGSTNGAAMRALPIGWASAARRMDERVRLGIDLAAATHGDSSAILAAVTVAAMGAWSVEGEPIDVVIDCALAEARSAVELLGAQPALLAPLEGAADGEGQAPEDGVPFLGMETVAAVMSVLQQAASTEDCIIRAVCLGGDTDTSAATAAGIFAAAMGDEAISWRDRVPLLTDHAIMDLPARLARRREAE